jgi:hypothetical protein
MILGAQSASARSVTWLEAPEAAKTSTRPRFRFKRARSTWRKKSLHRRLKASRLQVTGAPRNRCLGTSCSNPRQDPLSFCALLPPQQGMVHEHHAVHHALDLGQQREHHREFD